MDTFENKFNQGRKLFRNKSSNLSRLLSSLVGLISIDMFKSLLWDRGKRNHGFFERVTSSLMMNSHRNNSRRNLYSGIVFGVLAIIGIYLLAEKKILSNKRLTKRIANIVKETETEDLEEAMVEYEPNYLH